MQDYFGFRVAILFKAKNETIMGGCSLLHGTAFLSWQGTRGDNCPPIGRSAELGMLWIAVEEYDERNIQVVRYAPCIQITPPNKDAAFESHIRRKMCGDHALYSQEARRPTFQRDIANLAEHLAAICHTHGLLLGRMNALGFSIRFAEGCNHSGLG